MSVAGSGQKPATSAPPHGPPSAIEKKALALLDRLTGDERESLEALLDDYRSAAGDARQEAEDALLDLFADLDQGDEEDGP